MIGKLENRVKLAGEFMKGDLVTSWSGINCSAITVEFGQQQSDVFHSHLANSTIGHMPSTLGLVWTSLGYNRVFGNRSQAL